MWFFTKQKIVKIKPKLKTSFSDEYLATLKKEAKKIILPKVTMWSEKMNIVYSKISLRNQRTRWGSCSTNGNLSFNFNLVKAPEFVLDYVIIHELCHLVEHNHSERFWSLVIDYCPEYKTAEKWLKQNGKELLGF